MHLNVETSVQVKGNAKGIINEKLDKICRREYRNRVQERTFQFFPLDGHSSFIFILLIYVNEHEKCNEVCVDIRGEALSEQTTKRLVHCIGDSRIFLIYVHAMYDK